MKRPGKNKVSNAILEREKKRKKLNYIDVPVLHKAPI
jgi:hypothetical protein